MKQNSFHFPSHQSTIGRPPINSDMSSPATQGLLVLWYRLTAPPEPPPSASFRWHEAVRRGRLISLIVLLLIIFALCALPIVIWLGNYLLMIALCAWLVADSVVLLLNRRGQVLMAGITVVGTTMVIYALLIITFGGLGVGDLPNFDLLVQTELLAVSLLPARSVFVVAFLNSFFIWVDTAVQLHTSDLVKLLAVDNYMVIGRPIFLQIFVAIVAYLWVRSAIQAIARADRAEVIAALQRAMAAREHDLAEQSRALNTSIAQIVQTHRRVGMGDFHVRVHLPSGDLLAPIADSLNSLLVRFQSLLTESDELARTKVQAARIVAALREATVSGHSLSLPGRGMGTCVDLLILELMTYVKRRYIPQTAQIRTESPSVGEVVTKTENVQEVANYLYKDYRTVPVIETIDLCKTRDEACVIDHVSMEVYSGEILGILGCRGSGKTMLLDLLSGHDTPTSGVISVMGKDLRLHGKQLLRYIGTVPAFPQDFEKLEENPTVEAYLYTEAGLLEIPQKNCAKYIAAVLEQVGLLMDNNIKVRSLSIEKRRRLAFARALLYNPGSLIIDEPTAGVRAQERQGIWNLVQSLRDEGKTLVLTTTSWEEAKVLCDRIVALENGKLWPVFPLASLS